MGPVISDVAKSSNLLYVFTLLENFFHLFLVAVYKTLVKISLRKFILSSCIFMWRRVLPFYECIKSIFFKCPMKLISYFQ